MIDFSDGIRPEEIQENFEYLQGQISRERISVGGEGIAYGFDITPIVTDTKFAIQVSDASIIDESGEEVYIPGSIIDIELPELYSALEHCTINYNNCISLKQIPYSASRKMPAEYLISKEPKLSGIYINYPSNNANTDDYIRVSDINGTVLTVTGAISRDVVVRYSFTADRIDTIYLKNDNTIGVIRGTTSTTPSKAYLPTDGKFIIAYLSVESRYVDENITVPSAYLYVKEDMRKLRNLYTDKDNNLYICGTLFDDLQIVHMKEPKNPKPNTLWLNTETNTLYYWKNTDSFIYHNKIIIDRDFIENGNANRDFATYMDFIIGANELEIYHNGNRLIKDRHYYELYNELPTVNQNVPADAEGNSFRLIEDKHSGNGLILHTGDEIMYMIRFRDSHYMWVPINKMSYINAKERKVFCTNDYMPDNKNGYFDSREADSLGQFTCTEDNRAYSYKYQYFFFNREKELNMLFTPGRNELSILINQMILHADQFEEITVFDLLESFKEDNSKSNKDIKIPYDVAVGAAANFGWSKVAIENMIDEKTGNINDFDNTGIGFKLIEPLDSGFNAGSYSYMEPDGSNDLYVEAIVERRVCSEPFKRKLQRSATFVSEDIIIVDEEIQNTGIVNLENAIYRYNENQLEVFVNGIKVFGPSIENRNPDLVEQYGYYLTSNIEGEEDIIVSPIDGTEIDGDPQGFFERKRDKECNKFKINKQLSIGDKISYRITTNVYSYDHINNLIDELEARVGGEVETISGIYQTVAEYREQMNAEIDEIDRKIEDINQELATKRDEGYFDELGVLSISNMPAEIVQNRVVDLNHINFNFEYQEGQSTYPRNEIRQGDYLTVIKRNLSGYDNFLIPEQDYSIVDKIENGIWKSTMLVFNNDIDATWVTGEKIIVTGIKFGKAGR